MAVSFIGGGNRGENHSSVVTHWKTCCIDTQEYTWSWAGFKLTTLVVIGTNCPGSCKSNYHMIMTTMPEAVNQRKADNTMARRIRTKGQTMIYKTKTWISRKTRGELRCSRRVSNSCSTSGTCRATLVTNLEWGCIWSVDRFIIL